MVRYERGNFALEVAEIEVRKENGNLSNPPRLYARLSPGAPWESFPWSRLHDPENRFDDPDLDALIKIDLENHRNAMMDVIAAGRA